ncbi:unnamed protein product, partial [Didymodactylos carnosus]
LKSNVKSVESLRNMYKSLDTNIRSLEKKTKERGRDDENKDVKETRSKFDLHLNVTVDNFFTSVSLAKELHKEKITIVGTLRKNKPEIPVEFQSNTSRKVDEVTGKPNIVLDYNKTKGAVNTVDQMCRKYTVKRGTKRWPLCIFYGMIDIAAINALIIWKEKNANWNENKRYKRRLFLEELGMGLVSSLLDHRSRTSKNLHTDIRNALAVVGYPAVEEETHEANENSAQRKRKRCSTCDNSKDRKTSNNIKRLLGVDMLTIKQYCSKDHLKCVNTIYSNREYDLNSLTG